MKKNTRWAKARAAIKRGPDNFTFKDAGEGKLIFFRGSKRFDWEPIRVPLEAAKHFVDTMNGIPPGDIELTGRPIANEFIRLARKAQFQQMNVFNKRIPIDEGSEFTADQMSALIAGPAEPGNAKGNHGNKENNEQIKNAGE